MFLYFVRLHSLQRETAGRLRGREMKALLRVYMFFVLGFKVCYIRFRNLDGL